MPSGPRGSTSGRSWCSGEPPSPTAGRRAGDRTGCGIAGVLRVALRHADPRSGDRHVGLRHGHPSIDVGGALVHGVAGSGVHVGDDRRRTRPGIRAGALRGAGPHADRRCPDGDVRPADRGDGGSVPGAAAGLDRSNGVGGARRPRRVQPGGRRPRRRVAVGAPADRHGGCSGHARRVRVGRSRPRCRCRSCGLRSWRRRRSSSCSRSPPTA